MIEKMTLHDDLAAEIDLASDNADEAKLVELAAECLNRLANAEADARVYLHYFNANCHAGISAANYADPKFSWSWNQPHGIAEVLALRRAIQEPSFSELHQIIISQIRTNLGNRLNSLGRPVAALEQWAKALNATPNFAKAHCNRGRGLREYSARLYDRNHKSILLTAANEDFAASLSDDAIWESGDRDMFAGSLQSQREEIERYLERVGYQDDCDLDQWGFGDSADEKQYRKWCARNQLFLNPLNDALAVSVVATDVLHLPSHTYTFEETPRFPAYYNLLKQEYVSARYRLYRALHEADPDYVMRDVAMFDSGEAQVFGHHTEELRSSMRASYSIFDKIGLFLNDYFSLGEDPARVNFTRVWKEKPNKKNSDLHPKFSGYRNWPLRGLFFLSRDLLDAEFSDVAEPDTSNLAKLRNQAEHRFLSLQYYGYSESTGAHEFIDIDRFGDKALRMLKLAREAMIYVSLAMHREEELRRQNKGDDGKKISMPILSRPIDTFDRM